MKKSSAISLLLCALLCFSCEKKSTGGIPDDWWDSPNKPIDESGWTDVGNQFGELPDYVVVKKSPSELLGRSAIAYIAEVDLKKTSFEVWGINAPTLEGCSEPFQTPLQVYEAKGHPAIVINAGYFYYASGKYYSSSLEVSNGVLLSPNINYASKDWVIMYYPTRAAFIEHTDGSYEVCWTYWKNANEHYIYDVPSENSWSKGPLGVPNKTTPCAARDFEAKNAIGGSPVLIKGGKIKNTYKEELIEIGADGNAPRTAIGMTADHKLILFVCEGRNMTEGVPG